MAADGGRQAGSSQARDGTLGAAPGPKPGTATDRRAGRAEVEVTSREFLPANRGAVKRNHPQRSGVDRPRRYFACSSSSVLVSGRSFADEDEGPGAARAVRRPRSRRRLVGWEGRPVRGKLVSPDGDDPCVDRAAGLAIVSRHEFRCPLREHPGFRPAAGRRPRARAVGGPVLHARPGRHDLAPRVSGPPISHVDCFRQCQPTRITCRALPTNGRPGPYASPR